MLTGFHINVPLSANSLIVFLSNTSKVVLISFPSFFVTGLIGVYLIPSSTASNSALLNCDAAGFFALN